MKILYPISETTPSYGGIGTYTYKIINGLIKNYKDFEAVIITSNQKQNDTFLSYFQNNERVKIISLFERGFSQIFLRDLYFQIKLAKNINKIIKEEKIDIIHHQTGHYDLFFAINFLDNIPVLMTSHGDTYTLLDLWKKAILKNLDEKLNFQTGKILYREEKHLYKKSNKIISVAGHVKEKIINNYKIEPDKITTIYNLLDQEKFNFQPGNFTKPYKIGFIGRPYFIKGFYDLIELLNKNNDSFEWHLVTDTDIVKNQVNNVKNIKYYKNVPHSELSEFYKKLDAIFIPSYSEACPTVLLESILKGKICIVRNLDGTKEIMKDCKGYYFNDIKTLNLDEIFKDISENKENLLEKLRNNREKIIERYSSNKIINEIYEIYKKMI